MAGFCFSSALPKNLGFCSILQVAMKAVMEGVKKSNSLPIGPRRDMYDTYSAFGELMAHEGKRVLQL